MPKARIKAFVDPARMLIVFRFLGDDVNAGALEEASQILAGIEDPWRYDFLYDLHRHREPLELSEIGAFGAYVQSLMQGRDHGRATLVISQDPRIWARAKVYEDATPWRCHRIFESLDESLEWLEQRNITARAA